MRALIVSLLLAFWTISTSDRVKAESSCFFPVEYQGTYVAQYPAPGTIGSSAATVGGAGGSPLSPASSASSSSSSTPDAAQLSYSDVAIQADAIPVWGVCHKRVGHSVLLRDRTRTTDCIRCFTLRLRSLNVLQIHTEGLEKCYTKEEAALATCPTNASVNGRLSKEIILYRKPGPDSPLHQVYCPINGRFKLTYALNVDGGALSGTATALELHRTGGQCTDPISEMSNCPYGFSLSAKFRGCSFPDREATYQCLGDWDGPNNNGERFLALLDIKQPPGSRSPRYRCAMYNEDKITGKISLSLSPDSTCAYQLRNSSHGPETFVLTPVAPPSFPAIVEQLSSSCKFPDWAQGLWQDMSVEGDTITYTDTRNFKRYTMHCLQRDTKTSLDRFRVYARTQCGDETYNCIMLTRRGKLALEFQMGLNLMLQYNESLCGDDQFNPRLWITQGKLKSNEQNSCPISGEYTGVIPDTVGLCAKLSSDCHSPDVMLYTVSNCANKSEIYEERKYKCLGEWTEDGVMYSYTQRLDLHQYQCFVGQIVSDTDVFIKEAGDNCVRGIDPHSFGMKMTKQGAYGSCEPGAAADMPIASATPSSPATNGWPNGGKGADPQPVTPPSNHLRSSTTTRPWKPITGNPRKDGEDPNGIGGTVTSRPPLSLSALVLLQLLLATSISGFRNY